MRSKTISLVLLAASLFAASCASKGQASPGQTATGVRVLEGVVAEREREAPGSGGASFQGTGNYYLVIEAQEGDATARYRFQVTYQQWFRFPEGSHVQITVKNNFLEDIRSNE